MHSWSDKVGNGQPRYSAILKAMPGINKTYIFIINNIICLLILLSRLLHSAIVFQHSDNFANLSRVHPAILSTGHLGHSYLHLLGGGSRALTFTSVIVVDTSYLLEAKPTLNSKPVKAITGALIDGEWERLIGAIGMVLHERDFKAQLFKDNLSFTTAPSNADGRFAFLPITTSTHCIICEDSPSSSPMKKGRLYSGQQSPFSRPANTSFSKTTQLQ